ncbi:MAG: aminotransferase class V-fold PLP-dependent enzyme [Pseudomonadota bacterium]
MLLANGPAYVAIPGPSVCPERVLRAMHRPSPNIYAGEIVEITKTLVPSLKAVAKTDGHVALYIGNGHAAWEAALFNVLSPGDKVLVLSSGHFGTGWGNMAHPMGIDVELMEFDRRGGNDLEAVIKRLKADKSGEIKAVLSVQVDTSTGVKNGIADLRNAMDAADHPALLMVDCIACLGCDDFEMDAWGVDVMVAGCQKGLMVPPGMAFVFFNDKADAMRETNGCASHYWDWRPRANAEALWQFFDGTAPTHHIYGMREALDMISEEGLPQVFERHAVFAKAIWAAVEAWGRGGEIELNIPDPKLRSNAVTSVRMKAPQATRLRNWAESQAGITLGIGLGMGTSEDPNADGFFRFGHMGSLSAHMILGLIATTQTGLKALDIPHGPGGLEAASQVIADATNVT